MESGDDLAFYENKGFLTIFTTIMLSFLTIYWIYKGGSTQQTQSLNQEVVTENTKAKSKLKKITVFTNDLIFEKDNFKIKREGLNLLEKISKKFELVLITFLSSNQNHEEILMEFQEAIEKNIVKKHRILFSNNIDDGVPSIVRAVDPFVHLDTRIALIQKQIRFINQFWLISNEKILFEELFQENLNLLPKIKVFENQDQMINSLNLG